MIFIYYCYFLHISCLHRWPDDWCWEEQHCQHVVQTWFSSVTALHFIPMHLYGDHMTTWETVPEFRQFFWLFWTLVSDFFMVSTIAMETLDPTTMRSIIHEQTSGEQFFSYFEPRKWCFPGIYYRNGDIGPNDNAEHHPRADKRRAFFFCYFEPRKWRFPCNYYCNGEVFKTQRRCRASSTSRKAAMSQPRSGEPIFFFLFWTPVLKWCFPGIY